MAKEITLLLESERMSDEDIRNLLMKDQPFGELISPEEVGLIELDLEELQHLRDIIEGQ